MATRAGRSNPADLATAAHVHARLSFIFLFSLNLA
jgi:hypothetical protein